MSLPLASVRPFAQPALAPSRQIVNLLFGPPSRRSFHVLTKLDRICKKLRLQPGERLLDIGCGWGGLAIYAAQHYGVTVTGITLSPPQAEVARERAEAAGVGDKVEIEIRDYRDLPASTRYDKVASIGMFEHVGRAKMPKYFAQIYKLLRPGGLLLNHGIVKEIAPNFIHWGFGTVERSLNAHSFLQNYVFPGGELRRLSEVNLRAEQAGFEIRDAENMREHYALTLRYWVIRTPIKPFLGNDLIRPTGEGEKYGFR